MTLNATLPTGSFGSEAVQKLLAGPFVPIAASGAVDPHTANRYNITKAGVAALTLAAPTAADDGLEIQFVSDTAYAHTVTATGLYEDGGGHVNLATFNNQIGANLLLVARNLKWVVQINQNVTMS